MDVKEEKSAWKLQVVGEYRAECGGAHEAVLKTISATGSVDFTLPVFERRVVGN